MKKKHYEYVFLLSIIIISLVTGYFVNSHPRKEAFQNPLNTLLNSTKRQIRTNLDSVKEGMHRYNPFHKYFH